MGWTKQGSITATGVGEYGVEFSLPVQTKKTFMALNYSIPAGTSGNGRIRFNGDSAAVYARRESINGGSDTTAGSANETTLCQYAGGVDGNPYFNIIFVCDAGLENEKLHMNWSVGQREAGASNDPERYEVVGKYVPSTDSRITSIDIRGIDSHDRGSNATVFGSD